MCVLMLCRVCLSALCMSVCVCCVLLRADVGNADPWLKTKAGQTAEQLAPRGDIREILLVRGITFILQCAC